MGKRLSRHCLSISHVLVSVSHVLVSVSHVLTFHMGKKHGKWAILMMLQLAVLETWETDISHVKQTWEMGYLDATTNCCI